MRVLFLALLLGGCAYMTETTEVSQIGPNTYSVGATAGHYAGGSPQARSLAIQKANAYCAQQDRQTNVIAIEPAGVRANVAFQCVQPGAPGVMPGQPINVNVNTGS